MTRKNATKDAARARQKARGGSFMHNYRIVDGGDGNAPRPVTLTGLRVQAREIAHEYLEGADDKFGAAPIVFVIVDAVDPVGATFAATRIAHAKRKTKSAAQHDVKVAVQRAHAASRYCPFVELMSLGDLDAVLRETLSPAQIAIGVEAMANLSLPPPTDGVPVLAIGEGQMATILAPTYKPCNGCWHHAHGNADCPWIGVPDAPMVGMPREAVAFAHARGIVMRCPCGGPLVYYDAKGRRIDEE